jgi:ribosome-binding protein aMBF1 (putative translation factor)
MTRSDRQRKAFLEHRAKLMKKREFRKAFEEGLDDLRLAVKIAQLRQEQGLSQTELAAKIKTSASIISRIENGQNMELKTLKKIADALNTKLAIDLVPIKKRECI